MPGAEIAQYGIATFAVAGLIYIVYLFTQSNKKDEDEEDLKQVIDNNTKALTSLMNVIQTMQMALVRQEQKIDELLERARKRG